MSALGEKVKKTRLEKGITQQGLADRAGLGHSLITALESGRRRYMSADEVRRLARGLGVRASQLWSTVPGGEQEGRYIPIMGSRAREEAEAA